MPVTERRRLVNGFTLVAFLATVLGSLVLLLPSSNELEGLATSSAPTELSIQHLRALVAANPTDRRLRYLLARELFTIGDLDGVEPNLAAVLGAEDEVGIEARRLALRLAITHFRAGKPGVDKAVVLRTLRVLLTDPQNAATLEEAAKVALEIGSPRLAAEIYERLAREDGARRSIWLAEAARWYRASGGEERAAELYADAAQLTADKEKQLAWVHLAIESAASAGKPKLAQTIAERFLLVFPADAVLLQRALRYATESGDDKRARVLGAAVTQRLDTSDPHLLDEQIARELRVGDLWASLKWARRAVELRPDDADAHLRLAQLAELTGDRELAFREYRWLVEHGHTQHLERALALGRAIYESRAVLDLLLFSANDPNATDERILDVVRAYDDLGEPDEAAKFLAARLEKFRGSRTLWKRLALLDEQRGAPTNAIRAWAHIRKEWGLDGTEATRAGALSWRLDKPNDALEIVRSVREDAPGRSIEYWNLTSDVAWELNDHATARRALLELLKHIPSEAIDDDVVYFRLVSVEESLGHLADALKYATARYRAKGDQGMLSRALDLLEKMQRDEEVIRLLDEAASKDKSVVELEEYWTRRASAFHRLGRTEEACRAYDGLLRLRPSSAEAFGSALACSIERADKSELERQVAAWSSRVKDNPDLYATYALALLRLHRDREALPYIIKHIKTRPNDYVWLLEFADAVERLGDHSHAYRLRRHALLKVWPLALAALKAPRGDANAKSAILARAILARKLEGPEASYRWLEHLLPKGQGKIEDAEAADLAVSYYLADGNNEAAKRLLLKSRAEKIPAAKTSKLTIALLDNNVADIERLLVPVSSTNPESFDENQIEGLQRTGHYAEALNAVDASIENAVAGVEANTLRDLRAERADLAGRLAPTGRATYVLDVYGPIMVHGPRVDASIYRSKLRLDAEFARNDISSGALAMPIGLVEYSARASARYDTLSAHSRLSAGVISRAAVASPQAMFVHAHQLGSRVGIRGEVAFQDVPDDTPFIRALGFRDSASLEGALALTTRDRIELMGGVFRERTYRQDALGTGGLGSVTFSHKLLHASPEWSVLAAGMAMGRSFASGVASSLTSVGFAPTTTVAEALPELAYMAAIGTRLEHGDPTNPWGRVSFPRYAVSLTAGRLWPESEWNLEARAGAGTRVFGDDVFGLGGYYARGTIGGGGEAFRGFLVYYAHGI